MRQLPLLAVPRMGLARLGGAYIRDTDSGQSRSTNRRPPKLPTNGADLYVVRVTRSGCGTGMAKPCARCLEWCRWAGIRRVFHWVQDEPSGGDRAFGNGRFEVVKVNDMEAELYLTPADARLREGGVSRLRSMVRIRSPTDILVSVSLSGHASYDKHLNYTDNQQESAAL